MSISRFTREQMLSVLRELDAGQTVKEVRESMVFRPIPCIGGE